MKEGHVTALDLAELLDPGASHERTRETATHLFTCLDCWLAAASTLGKIGEVGSPSVRALVERFRLEQQHLEDRLEAQALVGELRERDIRIRRERLTRSRGRRTKSLVEELLAESRSSPPQEGEEWANLAIAVCRQLSTDAVSDPQRADLISESFAELASSRRRGARWKSAREALKQGHESAGRGTRNPAVEGALLAVEGAIEGDVGNLDRAEEILLLARSKFDAAGARSLAARTVVQLAYVLMDAYPERSLNILAEGAGIISNQDNRLYLLAEATRIDCLITLGDSGQAIRRFALLASLWDQFADPFFQLRRRFMAGRLLEGVGKFKEAESLFRQVIAVDLEQRSTKSLFLDLIYLFGSFVRRSDLRSAAEVCVEALRYLSVLELEPESAQQMRSLWQGLGRHAQAGSVGLDLLAKSRMFIRNQWRTTGGDALAVKESAI